MKFARFLASGVAALALAACTHSAVAPVAGATSAAATEPASTAGIANPAIWPEYDYPVTVPAQDRAMITGLLGRMTLEEKIGQLVQADLCCVTPEDVRTYNLGSILVGGNSGPGGNDLALAPEWLAAADAFYAQSVDTSDGGVGIPLIWGTDAVHGHSNIIGATIFPHNIGLGAARDVDLIERIGAATAREIRVTGQEWTFAPTVAVPQDFRWGRSYEGYSSDPELVASYVGAMVRGLQGPPSNQDLLSGPYVIASTKHFLADGGTDDGIDQGDSSISEEELRDIHGLPYGPAIAEGVATVMVSFSSWEGVKMTGNRSLVTDVLKDRFDFGGFVVSDWNAHGQVAGCTNESCPQALMAGVDMYMAPDTWRDIYDDLLQRTRSGEIPMDRIDEAVTRILEVKARLGLFEAGAPSTRPLAGEYELLGAPEHREIAREAVRKSLVLLRNDGALPLASDARLLVAGEGADDIARQSGGWTLSWQGTGVDNSHFPGATSIWSALNEAMEEGGGSAELSADGSFTTRPDAAVVVFGERPYAEFQGDRATLALDAELTGPYETMRKLQSEGIPVIALMITGRPLYVNPALNAADAFVVAWLPGSEGGGVADVLVGDAEGSPRHDFSGKLPADWPLTPDMEDGALFEYGYGLTYSSPTTPWQDLPLSETANAGDSRVWFADGLPASAWSLHITDPAEPTSQIRITTVPATALDGRASITAVNHVVQEGARRFDIASGDATISLGTFDPIDITREANADILLLFTLRVDEAPESAAIAMVGGAGEMVVNPVELPTSGEFIRYGLPLRCLRDKGLDMTGVQSPFVLATEGGGDMSLAEVRLGMDAERVLPCS
ncbi:glycoside hydrolase family 3 protein [Aurantiacibacter poecillastricola]|uniref:glycoside hydrolase family 3 protein n=1 Tax=Aurantiacibacter poecillastricola TaxID=3064385 RepID=UPI00273ED39F|nr:glycoside hydrolase family 3 protein [Aurantiacibacter sp. 219JJ12-13]MDP5260244.1 glycoside hydrolase family 3 N-terminal domain-containing protein [Aurantiacibacter sp. 219JJ12-13]